MTDPLLVASNDAAWRRCGTHDEQRDTDTRICNGCAADARPLCAWCQGSGTLTHYSGGLEWPEPCHHCRGTAWWPRNEDNR